MVEVVATLAVAVVAVGGSWPLPSGASISTVVQINSCSFFSKLCHCPPDAGEPFVSVSFRFIRSLLSVPPGDRQAV